MRTKKFFLNSLIFYILESKISMSYKEKISNTFLALNFINLSKDFEGNKKISHVNIRQIWDVILNPNKYDHEINDLLANKVFSKIFFKIIKKENVVYQPRLAAAASDEVLERTSNEFTIEIVKSNKDDKTFYLILTLLKEFKLPLLNLYVICKSESLCKKITSFNNKQAQMILKKDDKLYKLITNPESEIFIR